MPAQEQKQFNATVAGQKAMCAHGSRIAVLLSLNTAIRRLNASEAYPDNVIRATPESQIDSMQETLRQDYNRLLAHNQQTQIP